MTDLISSISDVGTWIFTQFTTLLNFIIQHPVTLFPVGLGLLGTVTSVLFRVKRGLGVRTRRR